MVDPYSSTNRPGSARSEQRLLLTALQGGTDEELSDELGISHSASKDWLLDLRRVSATAAFSPT